MDTVIVVTSNQCSGCFGVYSDDEKAYAAIRLAYASTIKKIDKDNRCVHMTQGETLYLMTRIVDRQ